MKLVEKTFRLLRRQSDGKYVFYRTFVWMDAARCPQFDHQVCIISPEEFWGPKQVLTREVTS